MKKIIIFVILIGILISGFFIFKPKNKEKTLKKIKVGDATITSKS